MTEQELLSRLGVKNNLPLLSDTLNDYFTEAGMHDAAKKVSQVLDDYIAFLAEHDADE